MAENEQMHRHKCESAALVKGDEANKRGQYLGWGLAVIAIIAAAIVAAFKGNWEVSVALVGIPVLGAVQSLILGHRDKREAQDVQRDPVDAD